MNLYELNERKNNSKGFLEELLGDHESIIMNIRKNINTFTNDYGDIGSSDFITGLLGEHEKTAWMLRAHLKWSLHLWARWKFCAVSP